MGDAASVESVNILVDIVISVVLRRLNSDHGNCGFWCVRPPPGVCGVSGWHVYVCVRRGTGRRERCAEGECVLSFYFTNNKPEEIRYKEARYISGAVKAVLTGQRRLKLCRDMR